MAEKDRIVVLTEAELEQIVFDACTRSCSNLYAGLQKRFLHDNEKMMKTILAEIEDMNR